MKALLRLLFFFETFEIKTKLSKEAILACARMFDGKLYEDYRSHVRGDGFTIRERIIRYSSHVIRIRNSFAPVFHARLIERDGVIVISGVFIPRIPVLIFMLIFFIGYLLILPMLFVLPFSYFAFGRRVDVMKESILEEIVKAEKSEGVI